MHITMVRLYEAAKSIRNIETPTELAKALNSTPQTVFNWEQRGVSKQGQLEVQRVLGVSATWLTTGLGAMVLPAEAEDAQGPALPVVTWDDLAQAEALAAALQRPSAVASTDRSHSLRSFAVRVPTGVLAPTIPAGALIVVDAQLPATLDDYVLVRLVDLGEVVLRQLAEHQGRRVLAAAANRRPPLALNQVKAELLGVVTQVVLDLAPRQARRMPCLLRGQVQPA